MKNFILYFLFSLICAVSIAQPKPGDVFREYIWLPDMVAEEEHFLRVGGRFDYKIYVDHFPAEGHKYGHIPLGLDLDLVEAIKAELVLEKVQSHEDTKGLQLQINDKEWLPVPDAPGIPEPQSAYMHHYYPIVDIPLEYLNHGIDNTIKLKVDPEQKWDWPQNIFYGLVFRIYYKATKIEQRTEVVFKESADELQLEIVSEGDPEKINRVEYIGLYKDYNYEGNGVFHQWHYHYHKGKVMNHIGNGEGSDFSYSWDLSWLPDQENPIEIGARVVDQDGLIYFAESEKLFRMSSRPYKVILYETYDVPENFVTREDSFLTYFNIDNNLKKAVAWQISWVSWSPGYAKGIYVNDIEILDHEGPKYAYFVHLHQFENTDILKSGQNTAATGKTPLYDGKMVHGMEVQWPGMMIKVKYKK